MKFKIAQLLPVSAPEITRLQVHLGYELKKLCSSVKDPASLFLVSRGMIFRNRYLLVLFKNTSKLYYSLQEHFNSH